MSAPLWKRKLVVWAAVLTLLSGISAIAVWRYHRHQQKTATALAAQSKKAKKKDPEPKAEETTPPPAPKKIKVTALSQTSREHFAEKAFISSVRSVLLWRSQQQPAIGTSQALQEKLSAIPYEDLPLERKNAWHSFLEAWKALADPAKATDPQLKEQGRRSAAVLNAMFQAHGDGDIVF